MPRGQLVIGGSQIGFFSLNAEMNIPFAAVFYDFCFNVTKHMFERFSFACFMTFSAEGKNPQKSKDFLSFLVFKTVGST
jgi:hypothetical protein